jgi:hypothetical protein
MFLPLSATFCFFRLPLTYFSLLAGTCRIFPFPSLTFLPPAQKCSCVWECKQVLDTSTTARKSKRLCAVVGFSGIMKENTHERIHTARL